METKTLAEMQAAMNKRLANQLAASGGFSKPKDPQEVNIFSINTGEEVKIRFVGDGDQSNDFFWRAFSFHRLFFYGVKGDDSKSNVVTTVTIPAYNLTLSKSGKLINDPNAQLNVSEDCVYTNFQDPINLYVRDNNLYANQNIKMTTPEGREESLYKILGRRVQYFFQGYIISAPESLKIHECNRLLKHFTLSSGIFAKISQHTFNTETVELGDDPINVTEGVDFNLRKKAVGQFNNYDESEFSRKHTKLPDEFMKDYVEFGPDNISDRCIKAPNEDQRRMITDMLNAFLGGLPYDPEWDVLGYPKYSKENNTDAPFLESAQVVVTDDGTVNAMEAAQTVTAEIIADISGQAVTQPTVQPTVQPQVAQPSVQPTMAQPMAQPVVQPQVAQPTVQPTVNVHSQTPQEVFEFLQSKNKM